MSMIQSTPAGVSVGASEGEVFGGGARARARRPDTREVSGFWNALSEASKSKLAQAEKRRTQAARRGESNNAAHPAESQPVVDASSGANPALQPPESPVITSDEELQDNAQAAN